MRQTGTSGMSQISQTAGQQLSVEGAVYTIGTDFIVRAGNVVLVGGAVKGMLLEVRLSLLKLLSDALIIMLVRPSTYRYLSCSRAPRTTELSSC